MQTKGTKGNVLGAWQFLNEEKYQMGCTNLEDFLELSKLLRLFNHFLLFKN